MKRIIILMAVLFTALIPFLLGVSSSIMMTDTRVEEPVIHIETKPNLEIHEGYVSQKAETVLVKQGRKTIAKVHLSEPVMVAMAKQEEKWGNFQFPNIGKAEDGTLVVGWTMSGDSHKSYGKTNIRETPLMVSKDGGKTWIEQDKECFAIRGNYKVQLRNGDVLQVSTPQSKDISKYNNFPESVESHRGMNFYLLSNLPNELRGVYFYFYDASEKKAKNIHSNLNDRGALRYDIDGLMPVVWWGDIKELDDGTLVAGTYPAYYLNEEGKVRPSSVSFYESKDKGVNWTRIGTILYQLDIKKRRELNINNDAGFQEPAFEILRNGDYICVIRTGNASPMLRSFSSDKGHSWTSPQPFTPNGVKPSLLTLNNGVVVLSYGRPGNQVRFNLDGLGRDWTEPIEMLPFIDKFGRYQDVQETCGYPAMLKADENSFYLVYSDFTKTNSVGEKRKSIMFRKITIVK